MQTSVWIINVMANLLIATSSNVGRPKRGIVFLKNIIPNFWGFNKNSAINYNNIDFIHPVPYYQLPINVMSAPYMEQNKVLLPSNMVMQPVINFGRLYGTASNKRNYQATYANFMPLNVDRHNIISVPNYNSIGVPLVRGNDKIPVPCKISVRKENDGEAPNDFGKHNNHKLPEFQDFRYAESREANVQRVSAHPPQSKNRLKTMTTTPRVPVRKSQYRSPRPTANLVPTKLSSFYAETNSMKKLMEINTSTPPSFTNVPELVTSHAITLGPKLITSITLPPLPVKKFGKLETLQPMVPPLEKKDEEIKPLVVVPAIYMQPSNKDGVNKDFNPYNILTNIEKVNSNEPYKDTVLKIENKEFSKNIESAGNYMVPSSILRHVIDVSNSIAPIRGKVLNQPHIYNPQVSEDMKVNKQSIDVYPNSSQEFVYLNRSRVILGEPVQEEGFQNKSNENEEDSRWFMPSDSEREISRGDVPDVIM